MTNATIPALDFGVQSFCFRSFKDNTEVAAMVRDLGLDKIEICGIHSDAFKDLGLWRDVVAIYHDAGVQVVSIGVQGFSGDEETERRWFECAKAAGAGHIAAHFGVRNFQTVVPATAKLAEEYGIKIAIHCHGGYSFGGQPDVLAHLLELGGESIGICLDTAWCMQIGPRQGNPAQWVKRFSGRIYGVHYKDFVFAPNGAWEDVVVGTGALDLPAFVKALDDDNFDGYAVLEYEADPNNPVPALSECVQAVRAVSLD